MKSPQKFTAKIISVYDGDTFTFEVNLPFDITWKTKMRLYGVNTPELRGKERIEGRKVRDYVKSLILDKEVEILVYKKGKYGRYVSDVILPFDEAISPTKTKPAGRLSVHLYKIGMAKKITYDKFKDIEHLLMI